MSRGPIIGTLRGSLALRDPFEPKLFRGSLNFFASNTCGGPKARIAESTFTAPTMTPNANAALMVQSREQMPKKLLVLSPYRVFPLIAGGKIRVYEIADQLSKQGMDVTISVPVSHSHYRDTRLSDNLAISVAYYPFVHSYMLKDKPFPYMYLMSFHPGYRFHLRRLLMEHDIVQFEHACFANLLDDIPKTKITSYNAHNVEYDYVKAECKSPWTERVATNRIRRLEAKLVNNADAVLSCSQGDIDRFRQLYSPDENRDRFAIVPNGVHLKEPPCEAGGERIFRRFPRLRGFPRRAIFSGSNVEHNRDAVRFIVDELAPHLRREVGFVIRGSCARSFKPPNSSNVFLDTEADDMGAYANACTVALNTVRKGSGTSMKVLHYLSFGLPVVSTEFGMRGYPELKPFVRVAQPDEFVELLRASHELSPEIQTALNRYSWVNVGASLKSLYDSIAADKSDVGSSSRKRIAQRT